MVGWSRFAGWGLMIQQVELEVACRRRSALFGVFYIRTEAVAVDSLL